jgi:plastocyanin
MHALLKPVTGGARVALLLAFMGVPALAGVIHGTLRVTSRTGVPAVSMNAYPGSAGSMPGMHAVTRGLPTDAVVYVDHVPAAAESGLARIQAPLPRLAQKDQAFVPRVLGIAAGTVVDFPNLDPIYHNVFSLSPVRRFDLGKYPRGNSRQVQFSKPGLVNVYCEIHSDMEGFVLVLPHHGFARPSANGEYTLPPLPAGHYLLRVWHPDLGEQSVSVDVPATGVVTANLSY